MAKKFDLYKELQNLGFYKVDDEFGDVLRKDYQKIIDVAWVGKRTKHFVVRVKFNSDHTVATAYYYQNSVPVSAFKVKTHLNEKRALNAIRDTLRNNEFEI